MHEMPARRRGLEDFRDPVDEFEDRQQMRAQGFSDHGQFGAAGRAPQQLVPEVLLQLGDLPAQRGLGEVQGGRGTRDRSVFGHRAEVVELTQLKHGHMLCLASMGLADNRHLINNRRPLTI